MVVQKVRQDYTKRSYEATQQAIGNNFLELIKTSTNKIEEEMGNIPYKKTEEISTTMA